MTVNLLHVDHEPVPGWPPNYTRAPRSVNERL